MTVLEAVVVVLVGLVCLFLAEVQSGISVGDEHEVS